MITKRNIAREALLFTAFLTVGLIAFPVMLIIIAKQLGGISPEATVINELVGFYKACGRGYWVAWAVALGPYFIYQFIRSCKWASHQKKLSPLKQTPSRNP